jgi:hypothetical protein
MAAITRAALILVMPEWSNATNDILDNAVAVANAKALDLYTDDDEDTHRRYLEAGAILYTSPFARDMHKPDAAIENPYRKEADERDTLKGAAYRVPGWTIPPGVT